ncbi:MAG: adenylate/guanylate cyclase domain-containing protein, partial [Acidimicrobiia bacterium]|nr:adenylate/guanylate cyclase domain-containing protein [Acidimicrobiia bacterium]
MAVTVQELLAAAGSAIEAGDFTTVVDLTDQALEIEPGNEELAELRSTAERIRTAASTLQPFGRRMLVTFLFCDIVGSTEGVRALELEEQRDLWNVYYETASEVVEHYDGHIVKYLGDGLLIAFGYPVAHEDDPRRAVHAALGIRDALAAIETDGPGLALVPRIGIHTGEAIADTTSRRDVFGLAIHKTDRVQRCAEAGSVVISEATARLVNGYFDTVELGPTELRSFADPEHLYLVEASRGVDDRLEAAARLSPFVGRQGELSRLAELWNSAETSDTGAAAVISGEAGIGKSRLARIVKDRAAFNGANTIHAS